MKISIFGLGYVGCVGAACLAKLGHHIIGTDVSENKVKLMNQGRPTIIEAEINELIKEGHDKGLIESTMDYHYAVHNSEISFIVVGTPSSKEGHLNLSYIYKVAHQIGEALKDKDELTIKRAQFGIDLIKDEIKEGNVEIIGDRENKWENPKGGDDYFADADFTVQILKWRNQGESVLLITQDYTMSKDIIKISDLSSVQSKAEVLVRKLNALGQLVDALDGASTEDADYEQRS